MPRRPLTQMQRRSIFMLGIACFLAWFMNRDGFTVLGLLPSVGATTMAVVVWVIGTPRVRQ